MFLVSYTILLVDKLSSQGGSRLDSFEHFYKVIDQDTIIYSIIQKARL